MPGFVRLQLRSWKPWAFEPKTFTTTCLPLSWKNVHNDFAKKLKLIHSHDADATQFNSTVSASKVQIGHKLQAMSERYSEFLHAVVNSPMAHWSVCLKSDTRQVKN